MTLQISTALEGSVIPLHGELGENEIVRIESRVETLFTRGVTMIVLDMAGVTHADFRVLAALFKTAARCERRGVALLAVNRSRYLREVFRFAYPGEGRSLLGDPDSRPAVLARAPAA